MLKLRLTESDNCWEKSSSLDRWEQNGSKFNEKIPALSLRFRLVNKREKLLWSKLSSRLSFRFDVFHNKHLFLCPIPHINNFIQTDVGFVMKCLCRQLQLLNIFVGTRLCWDGHDGGLWLGPRNVYLSWLLQIFWRVSKNVLVLLKIGLLIKHRLAWHTAVTAIW